VPFTRDKDPNVKIKSMCKHNLGFYGNTCMICGTLIPKEQRLQREFEPITKTQKTRAEKSKWK
jgi:hypothetical protein